MSRLAAIALSGLVAGAAFVSAPAFATQAYPPNAYFHFTDGHGADFRIPQAVPGLVGCDQAKLALIAKSLQKQYPLYAGWTYVSAECRASHR